MTLFVQYPQVFPESAECFVLIYKQSKLCRVYYHTQYIIAKYIYKLAAKNNKIKRPSTCFYGNLVWHLDAQQYSLLKKKKIRIKNFLQYHHGSMIFILCTCNFLYTGPQACLVYKLLWPPMCLFVFNINNIVAIVFLGILQGSTALVLHYPYIKNLNLCFFQFKNSCQTNHTFFFYEVFVVCFYCASNVAFTF